MSAVVRGGSNQKSLSELSIHTSRMATFISHRPPPFTQSHQHPHPANRLLPRHLEPTPAFASFVSTVLESTQINQLVVVLALLFLERYHRQRSLRQDVDVPTDAQLDPEHTLFLSSLLVANKVADDCNYTNRSFADVSGLSLPEVNAIERAFLRTIAFDLWVSTEEFHAWLYRLTDLGKARHRALQAFVHPYQPFLPSFHQRLSTPLSVPGSTFLSLAQVVPPPAGCYVPTANKSPKLPSALLTPNSNSQRTVNHPGGHAPRPFKRSAEDAFSSLDPSFGTDVRPVKKQQPSGISPTTVSVGQKPNPAVSTLPTHPSSLYPSVQQHVFLQHTTPSAPIVTSYPHPHQLHLHQPSLPASRLYTQTGQPAYPSPHHPTYPSCAPHQTVLSAGYSHLLPHLYPHSYPYSYPFSIPDRSKPYDVIRPDPSVLPAAPTTIAMAAVIAPFASLKASAQGKDDPDKMSASSWQAVDRWRKAVVPLTADEGILPWAGLDVVLV
ncbi:Cyclin [Phaffia rhodozyma]|uniref:Cyclin n=1 Tax=Phaffia rhodozyma TaxID=264483 RepID=A0A0F7STL4_PHARH|nr:Cyclin [Phaffia rhodozyma]